MFVDTRLKYQKSSWYFKWIWNFDLTFTGCWYFFYFLDCPVMQTWMDLRHFLRQVAVKAELDYIKREDWPDHLGGKWFRVISTGISVGVDGWLSPNNGKRWMMLHWDCFHTLTKVIETILLPTKAIWWSLFGMCVNSSPSLILCSKMAIFFRVMHLSNSCCLQDMLDETGRTKPILIESESKLLGEASFAGALHSTGQWVKANLYAYIYMYIYIY